MLYKEYKKLIENYIGLLACGLGNSLTIISPPGFGKTTLIMKTLKQYPNNSYLYLNGYITPLELYMAFYRTNRLSYPKFLVLDDIEYTLNEKKAQILLKGATADMIDNNSRVIHYVSSHYEVKNIPSLNFDGKIIMLLNDIPKNNKQIKAILDRTILLEIKMDNDEIIQSAREEIAPQPFGSLSLEEKLEVIEYIEENISLLHEISFRTIIQGFKCLEYSKRTNEDWHQLLLSLLQNKTSNNLI